MKSLSRALNLALILTLISGCGSSQSNPVAETLSRGPSARVEIIPGPAVGPDIASLRISLRDIGGSLVEAPRSFPNSSAIELFVPPATAVLEIAYLAQDGVLKGSFATTIDPDQNLSTTLNSPAFVASEAADPTNFRFAFNGCNRLGFSELSADDPSSANRAQLLADLSEIPAAVPAVSQFFFAGDLVTNLDPGTATLQSQLTAWLQLFGTSALAQSPVDLVPFTGNHEILQSVQDPKTGEYVEFPNPAALPVWTTLMAPYLRGSDGPTANAPNLDGVTDDQSQLSYTFQKSDVLFVVLNTDTFVDDVTLGDVPLNWLQARLDEGQADPSVRHIFVMGHKPIVAPPGGGEPPGPGSIRTDEKSPFAKLLADHAKVDGYLCAHAHLWDYRELEGGTPQLIAGNAGSEVEPPFNDTYRGYYGYTLISVHASGLVHLESWGRPIPNPYNSDAPQPPSTLREKRLLN